MASLLRATDYCTSRSQTAQISLQILEVSFAMEQYTQVKTYVHKVEQTLENAVSTPTPPTPTASLQEVTIKLKIASGLERLAREDYAAAADALVPLCMNHNSAALEWPSVTCAEDIARYASLLSLAIRDRKSILELAEHPDALELVPSMKDLLLQWSRANYVKCMEELSSTTSNHFSALSPVGDLYLSGPKWIALSQKIRERCLQEFLKPYQTFRLETMSNMFPSIPSVPDLLAKMIGKGLLPGAKLDMRGQIVSLPPNLNADKSLVRRSIAGMEHCVLDDTYAMLVRLACLEHDLVVQDVPNAPKRKGPRYVQDVSRSGSEEGDTPMMDADFQPSAANPEDMY